ncbi:adenosine-deaminase [Ophiobolus disseminans]|uniref:Adenosine-deaminase n=1 Tax=Ophiobolus disseminans TaxID=1469910 RepID=A0A6A6ZVB9_9PLEO|nr:adenosine-deaminase [Ophiobolus disseminans]
MTVDADAIADCVLSTFDQLPEKRKPRPRSDGSREWVPLAGIVLSKDGKLSCVSLGTGMKCLPLTKLSQAQGNILHDWHAEILAIRSFNRFLLDHCLDILQNPNSPSPWLQASPPEEQASPSRSQESPLGTHPQHNPPFTIRPNVKIHMYCSEAPCGDASMELTMNLQEDATPWSTPAPTSSPNPSISPNSTPTALRGRSNFSHLGIVRHKPSRPDAPPTLSKSCTDKLCLTQATSLLSSVTALFVAPGNAYIDTLVLPSSQYVPTACERAFTRAGRMRGLEDSVVEKWRGGYGWKAFEVKGTEREFKHSRRSIGPGEKAIPSNISAVWTPGFQESVIGGVLQGRKQLDPRGASAICKRGMWGVGVRLAGLVGGEVLRRVLGARTYGEMKACGVFDARRRVKGDVIDKGLRGWVRNTRDGDWER